METFEALILGLLQGLTEYLPVSSSGHLAIGSHILGIEAEENLMFTVAVHVATVLSTLVVLGGEIIRLVRGTFGPFNAGASGLARLNADQRYMLNILVSMIPIFVVGIFFKDTVESIFGQGLLVVGCCLLVTAGLLAYSYYGKPRQKESISLVDAFIIGVAQAVAVLPGLSRSGSTIATGLILGNNKAHMAQFSFLMVIPPILGEALLDTIKAAKEGFSAAFGDLSVMALVVGFVAAFVSGIAACKWMIGIVRRGKLIYFAYYCVAVGAVTLAYHFICE
ncbi:MAG: undecaprenyl-diphosphate phosphatase [Bacteroidales bacterium]|nr:undecaprenyl-diphosphate phosphatase [Bacteroidales bacterium]MDY2705413.1 undecaprenyl-diphosphate phosphatase [Alloprevotella sp.]MDY4874391.1 undecaprenyl-diphosphate phosphatase [Alloprevotella sp.]